VAWNSIQRASLFGLPIAADAGATRPRPLLLEKNDHPNRQFGYAGVCRQSFAVVLLFYLTFTQTKSFLVRIVNFD
jgi:hypothetical protein